MNWEHTCWIPVADKMKLEQHGIYLAPQTLRRWKCSGKYNHMHLFKKVANRLMINFDLFHCQFSSDKNL